LHRFKDSPVSGSFAIIRAIFPWRPADDACPFSTFFFDFFDIPARSRRRRRRVPAGG
jgi:hypothetical protein